MKQLIANAAMAVLWLAPTLSSCGNEENFTIASTDNGYYLSKVFDIGDGLLFWDSKDSQQKNGFRLLL